jgi:BirA family biotin operon repressor/biotin-[acetyl-CoA-carboxylase] ligase
MQATNDLNQRRIERALETTTFGQRVIYHDVVGSTNDVAKQLATEGAAEGTVVIADEQTAGRGRLERRWVAPPGTCLLCSLLFRPALLPAQAHRLTMLCSMAAADAIQEIAGLSVALKWPNDLIVKAQSQGWCKLAGILTESGMTGDALDVVIVGIGINVNVPEEALPALDPHATSILAESGREIDRAELLAALLAGVEARYARLEAGESPRDEWATRLTTLGERVTVTATEGTFTGVAESVDEDGALLLRTDDGEHRRLLAGDVTLADR